MESNVSLYNIIIREIIKRTICRFSRTPRDSKSVPRDKCVGHVPRNRWTKTVKGRRSGLIFVRSVVEFRVEFARWNSAARTQKVGRGGGKRWCIRFPDRRLLHFISRGEKILGRYWLSIWVWGQSFVRFRGHGYPWGGAFLDFRRSKWNRPESTAECGYFKDGRHPFLLE